MNSSVLLFFILAGVCAACASPPHVEEYPILLRQRRQIDLFGDARKLIENLVAGLRNAAKEASDAIGRFTQGLQEEAKNIREKFISDLQKLRERVIHTIQNIADRFLDTGAAVRDCVTSHRSEANRLFNDTLSKTMTCVDNRITEVSAQIQQLTSLSTEAVDFSNNAMLEMRKCTEENSGSFLSAGACLAAVGVRTEMKAAVVGTQSVLTIARINLSMATLPASLEVCAGSRIVEAGMATGRIVMEMGSCSASSIFSTFSNSGSTPTETITAEMKPIETQPIVPSPY